jgi:hypothetical protein
MTSTPNSRVCDSHGFRRRERNAGAIVRGESGQRNLDFVGASRHVRRGEDSSVVGRELGRDVRGFVRQDNRRAWNHRLRCVDDGARNGAAADLGERQGWNEEDEEEDSVHVCERVAHCQRHSRDSSLTFDSICGSFFPIIDNVSGNTITHSIAPAHAPSSTDFKPGNLAIQRGAAVSRRSPSERSRSAARRRAPAAPTKRLCLRIRIAGPAAACAHPCR